ncbi:hypothetical protein [Sphingomonas sp. MMS24-J13]|uniref:hypothetical protein n=1 Tax=Sphingomonas sp. MMS24-J13 TaxID=3238686 RepID=UPI00384D0039
MNDILIITAAAWTEGAAALIAAGWVANAHRRATHWRKRAQQAETSLRSEASDTAYWCSTAEQERTRADTLYRRLVRANGLTTEEKADHFRKLGALGNASRKQRTEAE